MVVKRSKQTIAVRMRVEIFGLAGIVCGRQYANMAMDLSYRSPIEKAHTGLGATGGVVDH